MTDSLSRDNTLASPTPEKHHWDFPCLEIPEAPLHHGGAPLGSSLSRDPRGSYTQRRRFTCSYTTWGSTTSFCVQEVAPHLPQCLSNPQYKPRKWQVDLHLLKPLGQFILQVLVKKTESAIKSEDVFTFGTYLVETDLHHGNWLKMHR